MLDLEHDALVRLIRDGQRLGDQPIEPRALEFVEPPLGGCQVRGRGRDVDRRTRACQCVDEGGPALAERSPGVVVIIEREQVERR